MGDEFQLGSGSWWDASSSTDRFESGTTSNAFGWPTDIVDMKSRSDSATAATVVRGGGDLMELGLSSQSIDWNNQTLLSGKGESSFRSLLQEDIGSNGGDFQPESQEHWRRFSSSDSTIISPSLTTDFTAGYGLLLSENQQHSNYQNRPISNYLYPSAASHFTNNTPPPASMCDDRSSLFPHLQTNHTFEAKTKNKAEVRDLIGVTKKNTTEKRQRSETASSLPAFKVKKEKMGDRVTALQQLVSPFGKTDTASVLSEAIEYIKFLHEQVTALTAPYMKNGAAMQKHEDHDKSKDQDLRTRGLCLVPVSSTFPVTHETTVDFWTPTFGGNFR